MNFYGLLILVNIVAGSEILLRLQEGFPSVTPLTVEEKSTVILRCLPLSGNETNLQWLHNGKDVNTNHTKVEVTKDSSSLTIDEYTKERNDGVYECFAAKSSASVRLRGTGQQVVLPPGFRFCRGKENAFCVHARACRVDSMEQIGCMCEPDWNGRKCDQPLLQSRAANLPPYSPGGCDRDYIKRKKECVGNCSKNYRSSPCAVCIAFLIVFAMIGLIIIFIISFRNCKRDKTQELGDIRERSQMNLYSAINTHNTPNDMIYCRT